MTTSPSNKNTVKTTWNWFQKALVVVILSLVLNHLSTRDSFPASASYRFPIEGILASMGLCMLIGIIAHFNFKYYTNKYFSKKVEIVTIVWFMVSTLGYITIMYIPVNLLLDALAGGDTEFYYLLIGLLITLLLSFLLIGLLYAQDIYNSYKLSIKDAEITIDSGVKITKLTYENIACFYSENKIVYTVQNDGTKINTDFTLNELEEKINDQMFFRANRQIIIHKEAVDQIEKIENGKLRIRLKASSGEDSMAEITISRYKRKAFMEWIQ